LVSSLVIWALSSQVYDVIYPWRFWIYRSGYLLGFLNFGLLLHFAMTFPKNQAALFNRVFKLLVYAGIPLGFIAGLSLSRTLTHHVVSWVSEISVIGDRMNLVLHFILVAAFVNSYRVTRSDSIDLERALWCLGGLLVTVVLVILLNGLPKLFWGEPLLTREKTGLLMLPFSLGMAVAIMRFHLFDIHILINRALVYGILTATVVIGYVVAVGWLGSPEPPPWNRSDSGRGLTCCGRDHRAGAQAALRSHIARTRG
jgi:hypothetical protein